MKVNKPTVVFDIETTGLDIIKDKIIDISLIKINPDNSREEKSFRVNPEKKISAESSKIHGINDEDVSSLKPFKHYAKEIHCYEPNNLHYGCLARNISAYDNIQSYNQALGNEDGYVKLTEESATQNTRVILENGETKINKLDSLGYNAVDLIKIDVEGLEMEVLKGAEKTLGNVEYLMIELNGNSERYGSSKRDIKEHLNSLGFKVLIKTWPDIVYYKT